MIHRALRVERAVSSQLPAIRDAYADARRIQREQGGTLWPEFTTEVLTKDIEARKLLAVLDETTLVGVFLVEREDPALWGDRERGEHLYLHRIARAATYPGRGLIDAVLEWGRAECRALGRAGLRMDTWADNPALVAYYQRHGFRVVERRRIGVDPRLPSHYHGNEYVLLEEGAAAPPTG